MLILDKYSRKILKYLNKNCSEQNPISSEDLESKFDFDCQTFRYSFNQLKEGIYIQPICKEIHDCLVDYYCSSTKGKSYFKDAIKQFLKNTTKEFFRSILCPIIVAFFTTLLTLLLSSIFEQ